MILSMTGFGRAQTSAPGKNITVEVKSLNSKQLDLQMRVAPYFREYEVSIRSRVLELLQRGKVDLAVLIENLGDEVSATVNTGALQEYRRQIAEAAKQLGVAEPADWMPMLLRLPDALKTEVKRVDERDFEALMEAVTQACVRLTEFRATEGKKLEVFFREKLDRISGFLEETTPFEQERVAKLRKKLDEQLQKLDGVEYDTGRLEQELIYYIEKLDVTEEKTRLRAHIHYFRETLDAPVSEGKKLGFIAQEMGREINTLGSKSNNADMQRLVVKMKDELEQIKEQVLNVL